MEGTGILSPRFSRSEEAIRETAAKYLDCWRRRQSFKQGGGQVRQALEELGACVSGEGSLENRAIRRETLESIQRFLNTLTPIERSLFVCRYWYLDSSKEISEKSGFSQGKVRSMLCKIRIRLKRHLEEEKELCGTAGDAPAAVPLAVEQGHNTLRTAGLHDT